MTTMIDAYAKQLTELPAAARAPELEELREQGLQQLIHKGFPTRRDEEWKYTNVGNLVSQEFALPTVGSALSKQHIAPYQLASTSALVVFHNGVLSLELSEIPNDINGLQILSLTQALADPTLDCAKLLSELPSEHGFTALNNALMMSGYVIHLAANTQLNDPIQIIFLADQPNVHLQYRNLIHVEQAATGSIVETFVGTQTQAYFTNTVTQTTLSDAATLDHYKIQCESLAGFHVGTVYAQLQQDSRLTSHSFSLGGALVRSDIESHLLAQSARCDLNGLYIAAAKQHVDHHTTLNHAVAKGESHQVYKGIIADQAHAVFNGKIIVSQDAQQTNAQQSNKNLLLSSNAQVDTKPQLEIFADDVRCSHGATVGQLDAEALYYLQTRGIDKAQAKQLLVHAFADEVVNKIQNADIKQKILSLVNAKLASFMEE